MATDDLLPPAELIDYISGITDPAVFRGVGAIYRDLFVARGLRPTDRVLDVGCGVGRIALPLADYLAGGTYDGFDISRPAIDWCRENITPRHPNFRFAHADVYNEFYNPGGRRRARRFRFPHPAAAFDFAFLTSVFTHLLPRDLTHYLTEVARVLRPGGRCVITFFLHNPGTAANIRAGRSAFRLPYRQGKPARPVGADPEYGDCLTESAAEVERVVAYDERWVRDTFAACGLTLDAGVQYGNWSGRPEALFQDVVAATKTGTVATRLRVAPLLRLDALRELVWNTRLAAKRIRVGARR
jgi:SAM-dependent methyltransferase